MSSNVLQTIKQVWNVTRRVNDDGGIIIWWTVSLRSTGSDWRVHVIGGACKRAFDRRLDVWTRSPWRDDEEMIRTDVMWMWNASDADLCFCLSLSLCFLQISVLQVVSDFIRESKQQTNASVEHCKSSQWPFSL